MGKRIELGWKVKDKISGYEGIVIGRTEWLHGCTRVTIQAQELKDGKPIDSCTFDEPQLDVLTAQSIMGRVTNAGGPRPEPTRAATPRRR